MFGKNKDTAPEKKKESFSETLSGLAAVFVSGLFIITFIVQAFEIPSGSMENTLLVGDHVFVDRLTAMPSAPVVGWLMPYRNIRRDEIIVFLHPSEPGMYVVKRVIGVPGDRLRLKDGVVYRNGEPLKEPYLHAHDQPTSDYRENFPDALPGGDESQITSEWPMVMQAHMRNGELVVPPDSYFGMGDHRDVSLDSRYWGFIPRGNIVGRPLFIYWSFETPPSQYERRSAGERISFLVHIIIHFFDQTRWGRMFHLVR